MGAAPCCHDEDVARIGPGDVALTMDDLRVVARYAVQRAEAVLPLFEERHPEDRRPRAAIEAAWIFADGTERSRLQRVTALDAHRAAKGASTGPRRTRHTPRAMPQLGQLMRTLDTALRSS